jgi:hypothetical protein
MLSTCGQLVARQPRFAQTSNGWLLRELSLAECDRVFGFIDQHLPLFSLEGLRYATEKMPAATRHSSCIANDVLWERRSVSPIPRTRTPRRLEHLDRS